MSLFTYILPSGAEFVVTGPAGATQEQADKIFYEQVAAGSLVGYTSGQTLTSAATKLTKFELSRLDRGTAGVDGSATLSIIDGLPVSTGTTDVATLLSAIQNLPIPVAMPDLGGVPLSNPIDDADIVLIKNDGLGPTAVGPLSSYQVQKLMAQTANYVDQSYDQITQDKGIGQYGFTCYALEQAGYVKPGTSQTFLGDNPEDFVAVMSSPSVWTGKDGIYSLDDLLSNIAAQNSIQNQLMTQGYEQLKTSGTIVEPVQSTVSISTGNVYTQNGLSNLGSLLATSLATSKGTSLSGIAQNFLTSGTNLNKLLTGAQVNLSTIGSGAINNLTSSLGLNNISTLNINSITSGLTGKLNGDIGALVNNATKFGGDAVAAWAKSGLPNLNNINLNSITSGLGGNLSSLTSGSLSSLTGNLPNLNGITTNLTNLIPGSLSNLTGSMDVLGKASQFASGLPGSLGNLTNLSNLPNISSLTGNLSNLNIGSLTGNLSNLNIGSLTGSLGSLNISSLTGSLGSLTGNLGNLSGLAGSLGGLTNIGSLFGGGGDLVSGTQVAAGFTNTVNRKTVDAAVTRILGSAKIPSPTFEYPSLASINDKLDISQAKNFLANLKLPSSTSSLFGSGQNLFG